VSADYRHFLRRKRITISFPNSWKDTPGDLHYSQIGRTFQPFPKSGGFLYCNCNLDAAPLEVSVHFRITSHNDPSSFNHGHDLLLPSGVPSQISLPQVACRATYTKIRDQLLEENLVAAEELTQCLALFRDSERTYPALTLFRLEQEFPVEFSGEICLTAGCWSCTTPFHLQRVSSPDDCKRIPLSMGWCTDLSPISSSAIHNLIFRVRSRPFRALDKPSV
jgi:hypothetical protein